MNKLKETQKKEAKEFIFNTAIELFRLNGYENTSIQSICTSCGIAKGTFYSYFRSKEDIIRESFREGIDQFLNKNLQNVIKTCNAQEALTMFIRYSLEYCNIVGKKTTTLAYICNLNSVMNENENMLYDEHYGVLNTIINNGLNEKVWKHNFSQKEFVQYISAFINGLMINWCLSIPEENIVLSNNKLVNEFVKDL